MAGREVDREAHIATVEGDTAVWVTDHPYDRPRRRTGRLGSGATTRHGYAPAAQVDVPGGRDLPVGEGYLNALSAGFYRVLHRARPRPGNAHEAT